MALLPIQIQVLTLWSLARDNVTALVREARDDDRGELTGGVILLVAIALAAAIVAGLIVTRLTDEANKL